MMSREVKTAQGSAATVAPVVRFKDMSLLQKLAYIGKATLCILTFGFAFPNVFIE
jgi:hypothetical protein